MPQSFTIAHLSDIHCGDAHFVPDLMERAIADINTMCPDIVICSGDLTTFGFKEEYAQAKRYLDRLTCESFVVIPGNHDSRNVGYVHFENHYGSRNSVLHKNGVTVVAVDSTTGRSGAAATAGSRSSSRRRPTCASSSCTTICCPFRAPVASATSSTTRATCSSACSAQV